MENQCELCGSKYQSEMMIDKKYSDFNQCYDCLFSMNFNDDAILNGSMGYNLQQYIDVSKKYHMTINDIPCNRFNDGGGCYVCMTLLDIPIEKNTDTKNSDTEIDTKKDRNSNNKKADDNIPLNIELSNNTFIVDDLQLSL